MPIRIDHTALYVTDLAASRDFYASYFGGTPGEKYHNPRTGLTTYFLTFGGRARLELMNRSERTDAVTATQLGWNHLAFSVGTAADVDALTELLRTDGFEVRNGPRVTGDGYYEAVIGDPDGNDVEIVADRPAATA